MDVVSSISQNSRPGMFHRFNLSDSITSIPSTGQSLPATRFKGRTFRRAGCDMSRASLPCNRSTTQRFPRAPWKARGIVLAGLKGIGRWRLQGAGVGGTRIGVRNRCKLFERDFRRPISPALVVNQAPAEGKTQWAQLDSNAAPLGCSRLVMRLSRWTLGL